MHNKIIAVRDTSQLQGESACHLQCSCQRSAHRICITAVPLVPGLMSQRGWFHVLGMVLASGGKGEGQCRGNAESQKGVDWKVP